MGWIIFWTLWVAGLGWVAYLIIKAPYLDGNGNYISKKDYKTIIRMDKQYD